MVASNNTKPGAWPQTQCANCQTIFEVPSELLESSDTRVRCGECLSIFDALEGIQKPETGENADDPANATARSDEQDDSQSAAPGAAKGDLTENFEAFSNLDETYSDFDLFSDEAGLPEVRYQERAREKVEFNFDSVEIDHDQTFSETLFINDVTIDADLPFIGAELASESTDQKSAAADSDLKEGAEQENDQAPKELTDGDSATDAPVAGMQRQANVGFSLPTTPSSSEPLIFQYHDPDDTEDVTATAQEMVDQSADLVSPFIKTKTPKSTKRRFGWFAGLASVLGLALLFSSLYLYRERGELYNDPRVRPIYTAFCALAGCTVPLPFDPQQMGLMRRSIYPHPTVDGALVINVVIKNKAAFAQRYPVLVIRLEENSGAPLATRDFFPKDYLQSQLWHENAKIDAGAAISITLEIKDPGKKAASFTLNFR